MRTVTSHEDSGDADPQGRHLPVSVVGYVLGEVTAMSEDEAYALGERLVRRLDEWGLSVVPTRHVDPAAYRP